MARRADDDAGGSTNTSVVARPANTGNDAMLDLRRGEQTTGNANNTAANNQAALQTQRQGEQTTGTTPPVPPAVAAVAAPTVQTRTITEPGGDTMPPNYSGMWKGSVFRGGKLASDAEKDWFVARQTFNGYDAAVANGTVNPNAGAVPPGPPGSPGNNGVAGAMDFYGMKFSTPDAAKAYADLMQNWVSYVANLNKDSDVIYKITGIGADGYPILEPMKGADGKPLTNQQYQLNKTQIDYYNSKMLVENAAVSGKIKDPTDPTGKKWIDTPDALLKAAQTGQFKKETELTDKKILTEIENTKKVIAETGLVGAQQKLAEEQTAEYKRRFELDRQNALAAAVADPRRSVEASMLMQLYGTNQGGMIPGMEKGAIANAALNTANAATAAAANAAAANPPAGGVATRGVATGFAGGAVPPVVPPVQTQAVAPGFTGAQQDYANKIAAFNNSPEILAINQKANAINAQMQAAMASGDPSLISQAQAQQAQLTQQYQGVLGAWKAANPMPMGDNLTEQGTQDGRTFAGGSPTFDETTGQYRTQASAGTGGVRTMQTATPPVVPPTPPANFVGGAMPSLDPANGVGGYSAAQLAQARNNTPYVYNPNLMAALKGQYVPGAGNKSGSLGQVASVGSAAGYGNFGQISPVSYRNMDADTQQRYDALNLANTGQTSADFMKRQRTALPGSSMSNNSRL
jgi:hypothetical protein